MTILRCGALLALAATLSLASEPLTIKVDDQPQDVRVQELLERYAKPNHLKLRVDPRVAELQVRFLESCVLDRGALSAVLRGHGVSLVSSGDRLFAGSVLRQNPWPAIPRVVSASAKLSDPTELVTAVLPIEGDDRLGKSLVQVRQADQLHDVTLSWLDGRVILTGPAERVGYYLTLAGQLSTSAKSKVGVRLIQVNHAEAGRVAGHLQKMIQSIDGEPLPVYPRPTITPIYRTNQVLLRGPETWLATAGDVVAAIDVRVAQPAAPRQSRLDVTLYALSAEEWSDLRVGKPAEVAKRLADTAAGGSEVRRLWHTEGWIITERGTTLSESSQELSQELRLTSLSLGATLDSSGVYANLSAQFASEGKPLCSVNTSGHLRLEPGVGIQVSTFDGERVLVLVARGR